MKPVKFIFCRWFKEQPTKVILVHIDETQTEFELMRGADTSGFMIEPKPSMDRVVYADLSIGRITEVVAKKYGLPHLDFSVENLDAFNGKLDKGRH